MKYCLRVTQGGCQLHFDTGVDFTVLKAHSLSFKEWPILRFLQFLHEEVNKLFFKWSVCEGSTPNISTGCICSPWDEQTLIRRFLAMVAYMDLCCIMVSWRIRSQSITVDVIGGRPEYVINATCLLLGIFVRDTLSKVSHHCRRTKGVPLLSDS